MKLEAYSIRDEAAQSFGVPFFVSTKSQAIRSFKMLCADKSSTVHAFPADFALYHIGDYHDVDGFFHFIQPSLVMRGSSLANEVEDA